MAGADSFSGMPDDIHHHATTPGSINSEDRSEGSTPGEEYGSNPVEIHKRVPSLRGGTEQLNMNPNSTALGQLSMARKPPPRVPSSFSGSAGASMDNSAAMAKARALQYERLQKATTPPFVPGGVGAPNGFMSNMRLHGAPHRPVPSVHKSAPVVPESLSKRRANKMGGMKLPDMGGDASPATGGLKRAGAPKLSDMNGGSGGSNSREMSKMDEFKKYIDADKGWLTFDGAATITSEGVNFHDGQTFSISLDEVEILDELGKGNYGTVYMAKHARPRVPRFGHGLSGTKPTMKHTLSDSTVAASMDSRGAGGNTSGVTMAIKEMRLELDDAKFTTILKELVILHECVSPYIIDFYGAFFQEGAVYLCIEYMDGGSIDKLYDNGIPENVLRKITYSTIMGLKSLKDEHNIIHRDVKPTNILVNTRGQVKICDFGVSGNLVASIAKTNIGCQSYMAPERISGGGAVPSSGGNDGTYSVQSDIWSLGLTTIECAMGKYPYPPEVSSTIFSQLSAIVEGEPPAMPETGYSDTARDFVKGCLHKVPKSRPTYAMLLKHPWLKDLSKPQTISEEAEEGEAAEKAAEAVSRMSLASGTEDSEVAEWVGRMIQRNKELKGEGRSSRPALHAVSLDTVSPMASPMRESGSKV
ncbi:hypothetical protein GMORB2_5161 [Geosmithia morbida]|uniref:mitogen-activated protein kinase kinase n=1 Tax=Geosmithia morbida TaxID=1094350 RepID=A0A9P4YYR0_9HYPO|nr:uncharacterized protein GMORB2_5161 [Geosmithia morbida]KAF4124495.1 hypothetical protein GMORB2_5161 [Geosmithia morbida]